MFQTSQHTIATIIIWALIRVMVEKYLIQWIGIQNFKLFEISWTLICILQGKKTPPFLEIVSCFLTDAVKYKRNNTWNNFLRFRILKVLFFYFRNSSRVIFYYWLFMVSIPQAPGSAAITFRNILLRELA